MKTNANYCPHADRIPEIGCANRDCHAKEPRLARSFTTASGARYESRMRVYRFGLEARPAFHAYWVRVA